MKNDKILVIGGTGTVGSEIVKILRGKGHSVYAATSKKSTNPNDIQIDVTNLESISNAFSKVEKVFLLSPPGFANQYQILSPMIQEAKKQGLEKVVLMSAFGANADDSSPLRKAEIELEASGLNYNIIRPNWFFQNFNTFWIHGINTTSEILVPAGDAKVSFIDTRDISEVAARLLTTDNFTNQDFDLTGPDSIDHNEVALELSNQLEHKIIYSEITPEILKDGLVTNGVPEDYANFLLLIFEYLRLGYNSGITNNVEKILGKKPRNIKEYVKDFKSSWNVK